MSDLGDLIPQNVMRGGINLLQLLGAFINLFTMKVQKSKDLSS